MIIVNAIIIEGAYSPEYIPNTLFGCHFDGTNFIFFNSAEEAEQYYNTLK